MFESWVRQRGVKSLWVVRDLLVVPLPVELHDPQPNNMLTARPWTSPQGTGYKTRAPQNNMALSTITITGPHTHHYDKSPSAPAFHTLPGSLRCVHRTLQAGDKHGAGIQVPSDLIMCVNAGRH